MCSSKIDGVGGLGSATADRDGVPASGSAWPAGTHLQYNHDPNPNHNYQTRHIASGWPQTGIFLVVITCGMVQFHINYRLYA